MALPQHTEIITQSSMSEALVLKEKQQRAEAWFEGLRDSICMRFEELEAQQHSTSHFIRTPWQRPEGGGGTMSVMKGRVFEKVGVNISTVHGEFSPQFRSEIPGADADPRFWATGISLVAHPTNPHVPAAHMNTRMIMVGDGARLWFGGGGDLNPSHPNPEDTEAFHAAFRTSCNEVNSDFYPAFSEWCEEYFYLPHRGVARGVGGIFYDYLGLACLGTDTTPVTSGRFGKGGLNAKRTQHGMQIANNAPLSWEDAFAFTQSIGSTFRDAYSAIVEKNTRRSFTEAERREQLIYRGRYAEYNLLYDRGTRFGLMTGGNTEAILMSLPPHAIWE